jgi:pyruvate,water dikinase
VVLSPLPGDLAGQACLSEDEVRYICAQAARIEDAAGGVPQDVEWAIARDQPFPGSVYFLQHRPETTWTAGQDAGPVPQAADPPAADPQAAGAGAEPAFDPVKYALRHVFKVPGT